MMLWRGPVTMTPRPVARRKPVPLEVIFVEGIATALRHMGAVPDGLMGPWDDTRHPDDAWTLAEIDASDMRLASDVGVTS